MKFKGKYKNYLSLSIVCLLLLTLACGLGSASKVYPGNLNVSGFGTLILPIKHLVPS